ncbi:MAG: prepilin-type N-terminal cleavage/methylation domain-containing protein, partial [Candidatus Muirbacterium halophilum]|nr:prepilin-type N-terminal cleavage/methylation domain-containing protein [Candidatus Muirbacterium halophilum]
MKNKGFTFIELMVSMAIIAVIVSFALPYYTDYVD